MDRLVYWLQDQEEQNFGDFLTQYLADRLFLRTARQASQVRLLGSALHDWFVPVETNAITGEKEKLVIWGGGIREPGGLSQANRDRVQILSVRGPLSASDLALGAEVPMGDPGLLLPALHTPRLRPKFAGKTVCIPHFHDLRSDKELLDISKADLVLRPSIRASSEAIESFVDALVSASFVLSSSLHGAITAAAYGRPFAFWDPGFVDLPTKWEDFAQSIHIPCEFVSDISSARTCYETRLNPVMRIPSMLECLAVAPYAVRPEAVLRVVQLELEKSREEPQKYIAEAAQLFDLKREHFDRIARESRDMVQALQASGAELRQERDAAERVLKQEREAAEQKTRQELEAAEKKMAALVKALDVVHREKNQAIQDLHAAAEKSGTEAARTHAEQLQFHLAASTEARQHAESLQTQVASLHGELTHARQQHLQAEQATRDARLDGRIKLRATRAQLYVEQEDRLHRQKLGGGRWRRALRFVKWRGQDALFKAGLTENPCAIRALAASELFDVSWYETAAQRTFSSPIEAIRHYVREGAAQSLSPNPLFDPVYYYAQNADVVESGANPFLHYVRYGCWEGRQPHPLFAGSYYLDSNPDVEEAGMTPLRHYLTSGWREGRRPHPLFDPAYYVRSNADVSESGVEPLRHYLEYGASEHRAPNAFFHSHGYAFEHQDVAEFGGNALLHYLARGRSAGFSPHPLFDPVFYASSNPDVVDSGLDPYEHYVLHGAQHGRSPSRLIGHGQSIADARIAFPSVYGVADVTVIVPVYKSFFDTFRCLYSVAMHAPHSTTMQVVLADDCPDRPVAPYFQQTPHLSIISHPRNLGFLLGCNRAASLTQGEFIVFLNNDTWVTAGWLDHMVGQARRDPLVAMIGCKLLNGDGTIQEAGGLMFKDGWGYPYGRGDDPGGAEYSFVREVDCVIGACFLVRRSHFEEVGGLNEMYCPAFYEEFDLAFAFADAGYRVLYQPASVVYHLGSSSYGAEVRDKQSAINHAKFVERWADRLETQYESPADLFLARSRPHKSGVILVIDDVVPEYDKHAGSLTMFQYLRLLAQLDFKVVYLPHSRQATWPYTGTYQQLGIEVLYGNFNPSEWLATNGRFIDYVWAARPDVAGVYLPDLRRYTNARLAYYTHDLHFLREQRQYELNGSTWALSESQRLRPIEIDLFKRFDVVTTPSEDEAVIIRELVPGCDVQVIPPYFFDKQAQDTPPQTPLSKRNKIIFVGGYGHVPNVDAVKFLVEQVMPIVWKSVPRARVMLVGSHPPDEVKQLARPNVEVIGFVEDLAPIYAQARMSVSPLRWGAGVKGKIVGSLQAGVPVVTTTVGNEGINLVHGESVLVADTPESLAAAIVRLYENNELLESMAHEGRRVIEERFSVAKARNAMLALLGLPICKICGARPAVAPIEPEPDARNWREEATCRNCWALNRMEAVAEVLIKPYRAIRCNSIHDASPLLAKQRIHEFGFVGPIHDILQKSARFTHSDFFDDALPGTIAPNGVPCEDIQALSFADNAIDLCISQDVFEHIPDPWQGFREVLRVLKPEGQHVCSIPYSPSLEKSRPRVRIVNGAIEHILPAEYHGDPTRGAQGALVYTDFGKDLIERLRDIGFAVELHETRKHDVKGGYLAVFQMRKPASTVAEQ